MTISTITAKCIYVPDGATNVYPVTFSFLAETDLAVTRYFQANGSVNVLAINTDYQVSGNNVRTTGSYLNIPSGSLLVIQRGMDCKQIVDYIENSAFPAETNEQALDRLTMLAQQLKEVLDRVVVQDISKTSQLTLPIMVSGATLKTDGTKLVWEGP